jgi:Spy/CpxP family protein refolding chaperone
MKRIISTATAAGLLAGALMLPAQLRAEDKPGDKRESKEKGGHEEMAAHMREKLGISEEQEAKLKIARRARRDKSAVAMTELGAATRKLQDQLEDKVPEKDLTATLDRVAAARQALRAEEDRFEAAAASILTPTQRAKMVLAMKAHMHGRGPGGMHGGKRGEKGGKDEKEEHEDHDD